MELIPRSAIRNGKLVAPEQRSYEQGRVQGVHITIEREHLALFLEKFNAWFEDRDEVVLVASGTSMRQQTGFIILEWEDYEIDPLFIKILDHEDIILDSCLYASTVREG